MVQRCAVVKTPIPCVTIYMCTKRQTKCCYDVCDFLSFRNFSTILFWPISLLIISSDVTITCQSRDKLEKGPSKFLAYIRNTIPAKSLWTSSEESPPLLSLFQCCYNDVDFSFDIFLNLQNNIGQGVWGKRKPLSYVIV